MSYIGNYAYTCRLETLTKRSAEAWLKDMKKGNKRVSKHAVTPEQCAAWLDCFQTLRECVVALPKELRKLDVVFEYVLPRHQPGTQKATEDNGIRADVLLISNKTVMVLEFKRREDVFMGHVRQARKYRTRIQKYHKESIGMNKKTILVLTAGAGVSEQHSKVSVRSRDLLAEEIQHLFEPEPQPHRDIEAWLASDFVTREKHKTEE